MPTVYCTGLDAFPPDALGGAVTIGNFDGVHRGHAALVAELRKQADLIGGPAVVVTFDPHPIAILAPKRLRPLLTTIDDRAALLHAAGADHVVILRTTGELLQWEARTFLDRIVGQGLRARAVVEGFNFRFGRDRAGDLQTIREWAERNSTCIGIVARYSDDCAVVSSSRVRIALEAGDVAAAARLLGRNYRLRGIVGEGAKRGATLGFPTANLTDAKTLVPGVGVYAVRVRLADGSNWPGAANIGPNPTFGESDRKIEAHLIDFSGDIYGTPISLDFVDQLRDTQKFADLDELKLQLRADVDLARRLCNLPTSDALPETGDSEKKMAR